MMDDNTLIHRYLFATFVFPKAYRRRVSLMNLSKIVLSGLFDPYQCFATPRSIRALSGPDPRIIADDVWAKSVPGLHRPP
jgi:hypothetical protein